MQLWGLRSCDTTRRALRELREAGHDVTFTDIRESGITPEFATRLIKLSGEKAVNRASATWRALDDEERERPAAELLVAHPLLMKRPVIEHAGRWSQGWTDPIRALWL